MAVQPVLTPTEKLCRNGRIYGIGKNDTVPDSCREFGTLNLRGTA